MTSTRPQARTETGRTETARTQARSQTRSRTRALLVAEIAALVLALAADSALTLLRKQPSGSIASAAFTLLMPSIAPAAAVLVVLRRRFTAKAGLLGALVAVFSLLDTGFSAVASLTGVSVPGQPWVTETLALALLVGAGCRRLAPRSAAALAAAGGVAMAAAPVARYGGSAWALLAAPAALAWGVALGIGLVLRDADRRQAAELAAVRSDERLSLARDLHDLVTHYVTGIVVRAQAARVIAGAEQARAGSGSGTGTGAGPGGRAPSDALSVESYTEFCMEVEHAGSDALQAMRHLVGMLRSDTADSVSSLLEAVRRATEGDDRVRLSMPEDLDRLVQAPELATTVHRVVLEALTNARRHAPEASQVEVTVRTEGGLGNARTLVLEIVNDVSPAAASEPGRRGFGLVGMAERVGALGGRVDAGADSGGRWRVTARLPLASGGDRVPFFRAEARP